MFRTLWNRLVGTKSSAARRVRKASAKPRRSSWLNLEQLDDRIVPSTFSIQAIDASAAEAGQDTGTIRISRTGDVSGAVTVYYGLSGTATYGPSGDYTLSGYTTANSIFFAANQTYRDLVIRPVNDSLVEVNERVTVTLTVPTGHTISGPSSATVTIADDDAPAGSTVVAIYPPSSPTLNEVTGLTSTFTIYRSGDLSAPLTVNYTVGGTATAGSDYTGPGSGSVTFAAGQESATLSFTVRDDLVAEFTETVVVSLNSGSGYLVSSHSSATLNITDNEPPVVFIEALDASASEAGLDKGQFRITRMGSLTGSLTVYFDIGGTATNGSDYQQLWFNYVSIPSGQASTIITITPIDDTLSEGLETVILTLQNGGYTLGAQTSATVTIASNE